MATIIAVSGNVADVNTAIGNASPGDTVIIPNGTWTWTSGISISKGITLQGQSMWTINNPTQAPGGGTINLTGGVIIVNSLPSNNNAVNLTVPSAGSIYPKISQLAFTNGGSNSQGTHLFVQGGFGTVVALVENCYFDNNGGSLNHCVTWQTQGGAIYQCTFWGAEQSQGCFNLEWISPNPGTGTLQWATPSSMGMNDVQTITGVPDGQGNTYIEDCTFINWTQQALDMGDNTRTVIRHCNFNNSAATSHGQDSGPNGARHWEIYNNTWLVTAITSNPTTDGLTTPDGKTAYPLPFGSGGWILRGGTGVIWGNVMPSFAGSYWGAKVNWNFGSFNLQVTPNAIPCQTAYPAARQPGQSWSGGPGSYAFPTPGTTAVDGTGYITDPVYFWANNVAAGSNPANWIGTAFQSASVGQACSPQISFDATFWQAGRDYIDNGQANTPKPGYTPYPYPHPLRPTGSGGGVTQKASITLVAGLTGTAGLSASPKVVRKLSAGLK